MVDQLIREVIVTPAYDFRGQGPKNYGISGCDIIFYVKGPRGAIQCKIMTDWHPVTARGFPPMRLQQNKPWIVDVGYHSREPMYEGQSSLSCCPILDNGDCYYDGTGLNEEWEEGLVNGGTEWLWPRLEALYRHRFEGAAYPNLDWSPLPYPTR